MSEQERENKMAEAQKIFDIVERKVIRTKAIYDYWQNLQYKLGDYMSQLELFSEDNEPVDSQFIEYLESYIYTELERLNKLGE